MRPLTDALPKPLLPFLNAPLLAWSLQQLALAGVQHVGINLHHLADLVPPAVELLLDALRPRFGPLRVTFHRELALAGTAGGVAGLWRAMGAPRQPLIALNGDSVMDLDLRAALAQHRAHGGPISLLTRPTDGQHPGGLWTDDRGVVTGLRQLRLPGSAHERDFLGVHILEPDALDLVADAADQHPQPCMVAQVYTPLLGSPRAPRALHHDRFWMAMDTPALLLEATRRVLDDPALLPGALPPPLAPGLTVLNPDRVDPAALLARPVLLGAFAAVGARAKIGPWAVIDATEVAPGAIVKNAVLFGMGRVEGHWEDCVAINGQIAQL
jgi:NDP-sugar pyrophosphorylase family protein